MKSAILIPIEGPLEVVEYDTVEDMAKALGIEYGYVERVRVGETEALAVDENGRFTGQVFNPRASVLYGTHNHGQPIVGPALYCHEGWVGDGEDYGVDFVSVEDTEHAMQDLYGRFAVHGLSQVWVDRP